MDKIICKDLISVIKAAFDLPIVSFDVDAVDFVAIENIAIKQKIAPVIYIGLKNLGYDGLLSNIFLTEASKSVYDFTQRKVSLNEITEALDSASILYIPLKGAVLRDLYPYPEMRTSSDIDVLIYKDDLEKAIHVIESKTSFKYLKQDRHDAHFMNKYVHLELHFSLEYSVEKINNALCNPWEHVIKASDSYCCLFTPEYNLFYIVSHAAKHFIQNGGIGIRPLLDIYVLRTHTVFDEAKVESFCENAGVLGFYESCCNLIDVWFNEEPYDEITHIFEDVVISGGVFGSKHLKIISNKRRDSGKKYISGRIFKTREELTNYYPKCRKYPVLVPYYQVVRWAKVLKVNKTKEYLSEFKEADSIAQADVEKYDKLLKAMRLQ